MIQAKVICDSIAPNGARITTMEVTLHRFVLAELNTHRAFSRNAASSRAIPIEKLIERVRCDPALPVFWGANKRGMQAATELAAPPLYTAQGIWTNAIKYMIGQATRLAEIGLHKQLANRLIEFAMYTTDIITSTDYDNFFWQRCHLDAQPEMKALADAMQLAYFKSLPSSVSNGEWHLPYIKPDDWFDAAVIVDACMHAGFYDDRRIDYGKGLKFPTVRDLKLELLKKVSAARCARVSYLQHDGTRSFEKDVTMFNDKLLVGGHWSPFEHVATPCDCFNGISYCKRTGNFEGWHQFRKEFVRERRERFIPNLPELASEAERLKKLYGIKKQEN
jgi:thymidylate synthase ThyX